MLKVVESRDIFQSKAQTIVNPVNCSGIMNSGLASRFKEKYPEMFLSYSNICKQGLLDVGKLWLYRTDDKWVLNFPTIYEWRSPNKEENIKRGLQKFLLTYKQKKIESIAFPLLGANNGNLRPTVSFRIMQEYLKSCDIPVFIYLDYYN